MTICRSIIQAIRMRDMNMLMSKASCGCLIKNIPQTHVYFSEKRHEVKEAIHRETLNFQSLAPWFLGTGLLGTIFPCAWLATAGTTWLAWHQAQVVQKLEVDLRKLEEMETFLNDIAVTDCSNKELTSTRE